MKQIGILIGTALLVALPVVGQDDVNTKLKQRIDALVEELEARKAKAAKRGEFVEQRIYDLSDLVYWTVPEFWSQNVPKVHGEETEGETDVEPECPIEIDTILEVIRATVYPSSWDTVEGADMALKNRKLVANTTPTVHKGIERCLATLRRAYASKVSVEIVAIELDDEVQRILDAHTGTLPEDVAKKLWSRERLGSVRTFAGPGVTHARRQGAAFDYIASYDVQAVGAASAATPIRHTLFDGCQALVQAQPIPGGEHALVEVTIEHTDTSFPRATRLSYGPMQLPQQSVVRVGGAAWLTSGATTVIGGGAREGEGCVFLVRATVRR